MTNVALLQSRIRESGLKKRFIAEQLGISRQALDKKVNGYRQFTQHEIPIICKLLGIKTWADIKAIFFTELVD